MPGQGAPEPSSGTLESVEPEYFDDFFPNPSQSLTVGDSNHMSNIMTSHQNSASHRHSRTLTTRNNNLFGARELGDDNGAAGVGSEDKKMWMIVITVSAGLVMVSIMAVLMACRPRHTADPAGDTAVGEEMSSSTSQVNFADTEALQPTKKNKKLYRPTESRA